MATNQVYRARRSARRALKSLARTPADPVFDLIRGRLEELLTAIRDCGRDLAGRLALARLTFREKNYISTVVLLYEAATFCRKNNIPLDDSVHERIKCLRNRLAHASSDLPIQDRKGLEAFLDSVFAAFDEALGNAQQAGPT